MKRLMSAVSSAALVLAATAGTAMAREDAKPLRARSGSGRADRRRHSQRRENAGRRAHLWHGPSRAAVQPADEADASNGREARARLLRLARRREARGQEAQPIVYDGMIYVTGSYSRLFAFDARTGEEEVAV